MLIDAVMQDNSKNIVRNWYKRKRVVKEGLRVMQRKERREEWKGQYNEGRHTLKPKLELLFMCYGLYVQMLLIRVVEGNRD